MKTIELTENGVVAFITIRPATASDELRREMLASAAFENPQTDSVDQTLAVVFYPRCVACSDGTVAGLPVKELKPADFSALPGHIFNTWWSAVQELNPRWGLGKNQTPEQEALNEKKE